MKPEVAFQFPYKSEANADLTNCARLDISLYGAVVSYSNPFRIPVELLTISDSPLSELPASKITSKLTALTIRLLKTIKRVGALLKYQRGIR